MPDMHQWVLGCKEKFDLPCEWMRMEGRKILTPYSEAPCNDQSQTLIGHAALAGLRACVAGLIHPGTECRTRGIPAPDGRLGLMAQRGPRF